MQALVLILVIAAAFLFGILLNSALTRIFDPEGVEERRKKIRRERERAQRGEARTRMLRDIGERAMRFTPLSVDRQRKLANDIRRAGWSISPGTFLAASMASAVIGGVLGLFATIRMPNPNPGAHIAVLAAMAGLGAAAPRVVMWRARKRRQALIEAMLPGNLELLAVIVGAGQTVEAGMRTIAKRTEGPIAEEFKQVSDDITYFGKSTAEALDAMAQRCQVQEMSLFVAATEQSMKAGSAIGEILKSQARLSTERYYMRVEEQSNKIRTKMIIPTVMFILPPIFIVAVGPTVIKVMSELPKIMS